MEMRALLSRYRSITPRYSSISFKREGCTTHLGDRRDFVLFSNGSFQVPDAELVGANSPDRTPHRACGLPIMLG